MCYDARMAFWRGSRIHQVWSVVNEILDLEAKSLSLALLMEFKLFLRETFLIQLNRYDYHVHLDGDPLCELHQTGKHNLLFKQALQEEILAALYLFERKETWLCIEVWLNY